MTQSPVELGAGWTLDDLSALGAGRASLCFPDGARERVEAARRWVAAISAGGDESPSVYGVNTGFGALAETRITASDLEALQRNLVRSHSVGVGEPLPANAARAMIALRAQTLAMGFSGVRPSLIEALVALHASGVVPRLPAQGSVGASGDLAPLAHLAAVLIGEGEARLGGEAEFREGAAVLRDAGLRPVVLEAKEGLALINGTQMMLAVGGLAVAEAEELCCLADVTGSMSLEALKGSSAPFDERIAAVRPHPGHQKSAANLRSLLAQSEIMVSHANCDKVQDPYSLRCMPQIHGASRDLLQFARDTLEREMVAATDNPLVFVDSVGNGDVISGGNFHGQPLALCLDAAACAVAELASVSERRLEQLVNPAMSSGLPPFLAPRTGLDSGFMMAQVTAAALVSENKVLCHPASVDSIPSSAGKEDHVSMGSISALKLSRIVTHVRSVLAIEAMVAAQGLDLRRPLKPGVGVMAAHREIRRVVPPLEADRALHQDIRRIEELLTTGVLLDQLRETVPSLS